MPSSNVDNNANGFIKLMNSQQQRQDHCDEGPIYQDNNQSIKEQQNLLNDQTSSFPILDDQCPALDFTEAGNDLMLKGEISLPETSSNFQAIQITPSSRYCPSYADVDDDNNYNDNSSTNYSSEKNYDFPDSRTPFLSHSANPSSDSIAKKKAQNRAAQKAFRERREARLKELQDKLLESEKNRQNLLKEIEELRKLNTEINAENRLLLRNGNEKATKPSRDQTDDTEHIYSFPTKVEFFTSIAFEDKPKDKSINLPKDNKVLMKQNAHYVDEARKQVLTVPATWEYLYKLSEDRDFDVTYVMSKLQGQECCHTHGPAYQRTVIDFLVEEAASNE
ncbi:yap3p [Saccharomyces arboricola H-6]|uniref:Yap3p n=1 Tax=Saccharomyces arboricola (strain H-6 / AS 2.3317 / CBS 10644) TaxID=1160507 RepID=J8LN32_SACAR|nr:yap3p [Saccharomyces arboricola H-6]